MGLSIFLPHATQPLSDQDRQDLPEIEWIAPCAPQYRFLESANTLGMWRIGHPKTTGRGHEPVELGYQLPLTDDEDYKSLADTMKSTTPDDEIWWRTMAKMRHQEIGFIYDQEYAKVFIERALRHPPGKSARQVLEEAGFTCQHSFNRQGDEKVEMWKKEDDKRGMFSVALSDRSLWLTHEKRHATHWTNLLSLSLGDVGQSGELLPKFHSPHIPDPLGAAADMAVYFTMHWKPAPKVEKESAPASRRPRR